MPNGQGKTASGEEFKEQKKKGGQAEAAGARGKSAALGRDDLAYTAGSRTYERGRRLTS